MAKRIDTNTRNLPFVWCKEIWMFKTNILFSIYAILCAFQSNKLYFYCEGYLDIVYITVVFDNEWTNKINIFHSVLFIWDFKRSKSIVRNELIFSQPFSLYIMWLKNQPFKCKNLCTYKYYWKIKCLNSNLQNVICEAELKWVYSCLSSKYVFV